MDAEGLVRWRSVVLGGNVEALKGSGHLIEDYRLILVIIYDKRLKMIEEKLKSEMTLVSLAMLKVKVDSGGDYLNYLTPFICEVLEDLYRNIVKEDSEKDIEEQQICENLLDRFGLKIPERTVGILLGRLCNQNILSKEHRKYRITGNIPPYNLQKRKAIAKKKIDSVADDLIKFSKTTQTPITDKKKAMKLLTNFLSQFSVKCLKAYLYENVLPDDFIGDEKAGIFLISRYVIKIQKDDEEAFENFSILVQGNMLANALTCPDLKDAPEKYKGVTFYLDTPLILRLVGLSGDYARDGVKELIKLLKKLGGDVAVFVHSVMETKSTIQTASDHLDSMISSRITREANRKGLSKSRSYSHCRKT